MIDYSNKINNILEIDDEDKYNPLLMIFNQKKLI